MGDTGVRVKSIGIAAMIGVFLILVAGTTAFVLLRVWGMPAGGERGSAALIAPIPEPRLQAAPQRDRTRRALDGRAKP